MITTEEVLPLWVRRLNLRKVGLRSNLWVQARGKPVRGWLIQQMVKLAIAEVVTADVVVHADSDVVLLRAFEPESLVDREGRVRLYVEPAAIGESLLNHVEWHRTPRSCWRSVGTELPVPDFITSLVPWKRENATALLAHIEANHRSQMVSRGGGRLGRIRIHPLRPFCNRRPRRHCWAVHVVCVALPRLLDSGPAVRRGARPVL